MGNGFLAQIAAARAGGKATGGLAGLQIRRTGLEEMRSIEDEIRAMEEKLAEEDESARKRSSRGSRGRLVGSLLGGGLAAALTGGASLAIGLGAGLGSAAGQELGARGLGTKAGLGSRKRHLDRIRSGLDSNEGMFFRGKRKDVDRKRDDINKFLKNADRQFDDSIVANSLTDALSGFQVGKFAKGGGFKNIFGKKDIATPGLLDVGTDYAKGLKDQALLSGSQAINNFIDPSAYTFGGSRDNPYANFLKKISPNSPFIGQ